jgi:MFS family permease
VTRWFGVDLTPLRRSAQFRRLYVSGIFSSLGNQATYVATAYQLRQITHSTLAVGSLGLVESIPLVVFGLYGGVIADRFDRRRIIITTEILLLVVTSLLVLNSFVAHPSAVAIFVCDAVIVTAGSLQTPSRGALNQILVEHDLQRASSQLGMVRATAMSIIGPALGGLLSVSFGPGWSYVLNVAMFLVSIPLLMGLRAALRDGRVAPRATLREAMGYARQRSDVVGTYIVDVLAMAFAYPVVMLPFVAANFHERYALSILYLALPSGALLAQLVSHWTHEVQRYGRAIVASAVVWGLGIALFGYATSLTVVFIGLFIAGVADSYSGSFRQTMWNESIPPAVRGRMSGLEMISYSLGPMVGQFRAGAMAAAYGLRFSLTFGGLACSASTGAVGAALRSLWHFDRRSDSHVAQVRAIRLLEGDTQLS